jgi:LmbE family N-acetylglucosaminyl deacetylase
MENQAHFIEPFLRPHPVDLTECAFPPTARLLVLAPHPDDFDMIGVTLRWFRDRGNPIFLAVVSLSPGGVDGGFLPTATPEAKAAVREDEQRRSCRYFGLPEERLTFLRLSEDDAGHTLESPENRDRVRAHLFGVRPDVVFLPHGNDPNTGHRRTGRLLADLAPELPLPPAALFCRDPKTVSMRYDLYTPFEEEAAAWKAALLRFHASQQQRNLNRRGQGLDGRILDNNRSTARDCPGQAAYAEGFEVAFWKQGSPHSQKPAHGPLGAL